MGYTFLEHAANVKFRADGVRIEEMLVSAAEALNETIRGDIAILEQEERVFEVEFDIEVKEGNSLDNPCEVLSSTNRCSGYMSLLYSFLEKILVLLDEDDFLVSKIKSIEIKDGKLRCVVLGDKVENYVFTNDVKAVTYSDMFVREEDGKFVCQVLLDV